jgi:hypothetical protein
MANCTVRYCFDLNVEDGDAGYLYTDVLTLIKVPLRDVRYPSKDPVTNRITFTGNAIKHVKGVSYFVDCL